MNDKATNYEANMAGVAAVDKAMRVVVALEAARAPLRLSEIAAATGLYKSAVLRLLASLEKCGLVVRRSDSAYCLGNLAFRLGRAFDSSFRFREHLLPLMQKLVDAGAPSPSFHIVHDEATRFCVLRLDSNHSTLDRVRAGDLLPLAAGAAGKVLRKVPSDFLADQWPWIHQSRGERDPSCGALSAPIIGPGDTLLGALSLSGPLAQFTDASVEFMAPLLIEACQQGSLALGGRARHGVTAG
ncbi:helix-turn-helix domain-containing protein [Acidovorax sp. CCYZU-2555]|uniref:IclR family transcriptional regulator n=1 Tax=Acidovorax sp. CCYZU-2555 TaxID=2835042 RepID=UPI0020BD747A|nr:helix-turn-helix domain-containing protein [Acidovorax sp. CCYZU-2555]